MTLAFQEMAESNQLLNKRVKDVEVENKVLKKKAQESNDEVAVLVEKINELERKDDTLCKKFEAIDQAVQIREYTPSALVPRTNDQLEEQVRREQHAKSASGFAYLVQCNAQKVMILY